MQMVSVVYKLGGGSSNILNFLKLFFQTIWNTCVEFGNYFIALHKQNPLLTKYGHMLLRFFLPFKNVDFIKG